MPESNYNKLLTILAFHQIGDVFQPNEWTKLLNKHTKKQTLLSENLPITKFTFNLSYSLWH